MQTEQLVAAMQALVGSTILAADDSADPTLALFYGWKLAAVEHITLLTDHGLSDLDVVLCDDTGLEYRLAFLAADVECLDTVADSFTTRCGVRLRSGRTISLTLSRPDRPPSRTRLHLADRVPEGCRP